MSGISETINAHPPSAGVCPQCKREEESRDANGKRLSCLMVAAAVPGIGVVCWCSDECADAWIQQRAGA